MKHLYYGLFGPNAEGRQQQQLQQLGITYTQVVSDVDDTLKSSGGVSVAGVTLGGIDVQYPRGAIYPGVAEFMLQVSLGPHATPTVPAASSNATTTTNNNYSSSQRKRRGSGRIAASKQPRVLPPKVAILTARAEEFKLALELKDDSKLGREFMDTGRASGYDGWGIGPVLYGSVAEWIVQDRKGLRKFSNFERLLQQDPTGMILQYVYVGDTGELDQQAGETMLREYPDVVKAVFLHVVSDDVPTAPDTQQDVQVPPPKLINGRPIVFFRTYVGAAVAAVQLGLISVEGLQKIMRSACLQLNDEPPNSDKWLDLEEDLLKALRFLKL